MTSFFRNKIETKSKICKKTLYDNNVTKKVFQFAEESDEEDDAAPRKRRRAERAAEGEVEDEEVHSWILTSF